MKSKIEGFAVSSNRQTAYTGNLDVSTIQHSPIGPFPDPNFVEELPSVEALRKLKENRLSGYEDYLCWGSIEKSPGEWDWSPYHRTLDRLSEAGLQFVIYTWLHFPPVWYADRNPGELMRCLEHDQPTRVASFFSPHTLEKYREFYKRAKEEFGDSIAIIYGSLNGPYGEGNFPLPNVDPFVNQLHSHEGWWIGDAYAKADFREAAKKRFSTLDDLNNAWGSHFAAWDQVDYPLDFLLNRKPLDPERMTSAERRAWLDFCEWQQNVLPIFARKVSEAVLEFFPPEKIKLKPGGCAGGINPLSWGTNCPAFAKLLSGLGVGVQPADAHGAVFGDKWVYTSYRYYGIPFSTETAGAVDTNTQVRRIFSDVSAGAIQFFTYEYEKHQAVAQRYLSLYQGRAPKVSVAVYAPITSYRLGISLDTTIRASDRLRDLTDFDVLDELLIRDGFLSKYTHLVLFQAEWMEADVLKAIQKWAKDGGVAIVFADRPTRTPDGSDLFALGQVFPVEKLNKEPKLEFLIPSLPGNEDLKADGLWITVFTDGKWLLYNNTDAAISRQLKNGALLKDVSVGAYEILELDWSV